MALASREKRILLTEDKDFGQLVFAAAQSVSGVVFIRYPVTARATLSQSVLDLVSKEQDRLYGAFAVLQPGRIRITRSP